MDRLVWVMLAIALLTAGCLSLGSGEEASEDAPAEPTEADEPADEPAGSAAEEEQGEGEATQGEGLDRGIASPPELEDGEWWTVRIESEFTGHSTEATLVKAGGHGDAYMVGMPDSEFVDDAVLLHLPPHGSVQADTMGYPVHDATFHPLNFPLQEGTTWETTWIRDPLEAEVVEADADAGTATIEMIGDNQFVEVTYDAEVGMPTSIQLEGYGGYEVVDHGFDYEGEIHVPWEPTVLFMNGRIAGAISTELRPAPPVEEVEVSGEHDEAVAALLLGNLLNPAPGVYRASLEAPGGTTHEETFVAGPGESFLVSSTVVEEPIGTWRMEYVAGGAGIAAAETIGYDAMHVVLEDGEFRMMDME